MRFVAFFKKIFKATQSIATYSLEFTALGCRNLQLLTWYTVLKNIETSTKKFPWSYYRARFRWKLVPMQHNAIPVPYFHFPRIFNIIKTIKGLKTLLNPSHIVKFPSTLPIYPINLTVILTLINLTQHWRIPTF